LRFLCGRRRRQGVAPKLDPHQAIGAGFRYVVWRWATTLGGGASSPVAKEGPLSSGGPLRRQTVAIEQHLTQQSLRLMLTLLGGQPKPRARKPKTTLTVTIGDHRHAGARTLQARCGRRLLGPDKRKSAREISELRQGLPPDMVNACENAMQIL